MNEKVQIEHYLEQKVNPLLQELLTNIIKTRPKNILNFCRNWFQKKSQHLQMFPDLSDSDSDEDQHKAIELKNRKGTVRWYQQRKGICGEVYGSHNLWDDFQVPVIHRKSTVNSRILFRLKSLFLFKEFDDHDINRIIAGMTQVCCKKDTLVVEEGKSDGDMFVVDSGELQIVKGQGGEEVKIKTIKEGEMFGQMSMLYNVPRWASVRAKTDCVLFKLDRKSYHSLVNDRNLKKRKVFQNGINKIEVLKQLQLEERYKLQDLVNQMPIHLNQYVIREGKNNKMFFIVQSGKYISLKKEKNGHQKIINEFKEGDIFGQECLYSKQTASESIMSLTNGKLLAVQRDAFERVLGPVSKIMKRSIEVYEKYKNAHMLSNYVNS